MLVPTPIQARTAAVQARIGTTAGTVQAIIDQHWNGLSDSEEQRLKRQLDWFRSLPAERRKKLRRCWQSMAPEQRERVRRLP